MLAMVRFLTYLLAAALHLLVASTESANHFFSANCVSDAADVPSCRISVGKALDAQAVGFFQDDIESNGWGRLLIKTASSTGRLDAFAGGYLEGYLTAHRIVQHFENQFKGKGVSQYPHAVADFVEASDRWWGKGVAAADANDKYWGAVGFIRNQFEGLVDGINAGLVGTGGRRQMTRLDVLMMNNFFDLEDVKQAINITERVPYENMSKEALTDWNRQHGHCSAIVKFLPDGSDIFIGHNSWMDFHLMLRIFKRYEFGSNTAIAMSSFPGVISSSDDFYQIGKLVIIETTLPNYNNDLFNLIKPESLPFWIRAMAANQLATTGPEWMNIFQRHNSGTYNNMWMILDYSKFAAGQPLREGLLTVGEQSPGYFHYEDQTKTLAYGYWPSYNAAVYPETAHLIKQDHMEKTQGNNFSYQMVERAQIFRRDQGSIMSDDDMQRVMRYNKFQTDPIAHGDPCSQLACRRDLDSRPAKRKAFGAIDAKYTSAEHVRAGRTIIVSGPTHDDQPAFEWRAAPETDFGLPHVGHPDRYDFGWIVINADLGASPWHGPKSKVKLDTFVMIILASIAVVGLTLAVAWKTCLSAKRKQDVPISSPDGGYGAYKRLMGSPASSTWSTAYATSPPDNRIIFSPCTES